MTTHEINRTIDAVWRIESARLIAGLTRLVGDVGLAEDLAQDALVVALEKWPVTGVPQRPGAWLMATAKHRAVDQLRRRQMLDRKHPLITYEMESEQESSVEKLEAGLDNPVSDDLLRLIFIAAHPILSREARIALTLKLLGGLTTPEIARAFLVPEATVAQRIVRAKKALAEAGVPFEVPRGEQLRERVDSVLEVIYLIFNEGYSATGGDDWMRPELCHDALRLGRILAELTPGEAEVHGLVALMELQESRSRSRLTSSGEPILLMDQDRSRWDQLLIRRGLSALQRARSVAVVPGAYLIQAEIAACHARARRPEETDWHRIASVYAALGSISPSPIVELNRAVAVSRAEGPAAGLEIVERISAGGRLKGYHLLPAVRADLLMKMDRWAEAAADLDRAAELTANQRERELLLDRARTCRTQIADTSLRSSRSPGSTTH